MKMNRAIAVALAFVAAATQGCHRNDDKPARDPGRSTASKPAAKKNQPIESAMAAIPPQMRVPFQAALACEVKRLPKGDKAITITPAYVRDLTARLKADPSISRC